jgi:hypothetical protein
MRLLAVVLFLVLLPRAALAEEPEAVYAKYHRAAMAGDLDEMLLYGLGQRRAEMQGAPAARREAVLKMARNMMPRAFKLERKTLEGTNRATLVVSGPWEGDEDKMQKIYGVVNMILEGGTWKVDDASWNTDKPALLSAPKPAAPHAAPAAHQAPARSAVISGKGAPVVGSMAAEAPGSKLGPAKPECVYKPVMTAQDIENCR